MFVLILRIGLKRFCLQFKLTKLLFVTTGLSVGGAERALYSLINGGLLSHFEIQILSLTDLGHYGNKFQTMGIVVNCLYLKNPFYFFLSVLRILWISWKFKPDLVQGWMYHGNIFSFFIVIFLFFKPKLFWGIRQTFYDISKEKFLTRIVIRMNVRFSPFTNAVIYNSQKSQIQHEAFGFSARNSHYIPNGFDFALWKKDLSLKKQLRQQLNIPDNAFVVGYVGRYHPMKNIELLFDSMIYILNKYSYVYFYIIGKNTNSSNPSLKHYYDKIPSNRFFSFGEIDDVPKFIQCIDLLCLTSSWGEGFPNVIGEAMSVGIPCVATDIGDSSFVIGDTGWIIPPGDIFSLIRAIESAMSEPASFRHLRSEFAINRISKNFNINSVVKQYKEIYLSADFK